MRFHEQLKTPTTPAHDRACAAIMRMPVPDVLASFFPGWSRQSLDCVTVKWLPEEPVREAHRGNLVGFIDLAAHLAWIDGHGEQSCYIGIEVKTSGDSIGSAVRQVKTYRGGLIRCSNIPMNYGVVDLCAVSRFRLDQVALALPQDQITDEVRLLATGLPVLGWSENLPTVGASQSEKSDFSCLAD